MKTNGKCRSVSFLEVVLIFPLFPPVCALAMAVCVLFWIPGAHGADSQPTPAPLGPKETIKGWTFGDKSLEQVLPWFRANTEEEKKVARAFAKEGIATTRLANAVGARWGHAAETEVSHLCFTDTPEDDQAATLNILGEHAKLLFDVPGLVPIYLIQSDGVWRVDVAAYIRVVGKQMPLETQGCDQISAMCDRVAADVAAGKYATAEAVMEDLKKALASLPSFSIDVAQMVEEGNKKRFAGDQDGAIAIYNEAIAFAPFDAEAYNMRAFSELEKKDVEKAIADLREAVRFDPKDSIYHNNLANALQDHGELDSADAEYHEALRLDPENISAHMDRGKLRIQRADYAGAIDDLTKAASIKPPYPSTYKIDGYSIEELALIYKLLGDAKLKAKDYEGASAAYTSAISETRKFPAAYKGRAEAREAMGKAEEAKEDRAAAKKIEDDPDKMPEFNWRRMLKGLLP